MCWQPGKGVQEPRSSQTGCRVPSLPKPKTSTLGKGCQWAFPTKSQNFPGHVKILSRLYQDLPTTPVPVTLKKWGSQKRNWALLHDRRDPEDRLKYSEHQTRLCWGKGGFITPGFPRGKADKPQNHCKSLLFPEWEIPMRVFTQSLGPPPSASSPTGLQSWVPVLTS